ncbi:MAG: hypothetical protein O8C62_11300 [Candidatus Methanoperedens sp.]|nr:hypothetical protein [Candidatus Methanoperedens sp.]
MEIGSTEMQVLDKYIQDFIPLFPSHPKTQDDFKNLKTTKKVTVRILCKLSEWCNTDPSRQKGMDIAKKISQILFEGIIPKLDGYKLKELCEIKTENNILQIVN